MGKRHSELLDVLSEVKTVEDLHRIPERLRVDAWIEADDQFQSLREGIDALKLLSDPTDETRALIKKFDEAHPNA